EAEIARLERRQRELESARRSRIAALATRRRELLALREERPAVARERVEAWRRLEAERDGELARRLERTRADAGDAEAEAERHRERSEEAAREAVRLRGPLEAAREADLEGRATRLAAGPDGSGQEAEREPSPLAEWGYRGLMGLLLVLLAVALVLPSDLLTPIALPFLVGFVVLAVGVLVWRLRRKKGQAARRERSERRRTVLRDAREVGLDVQTIEEIPARLRDLDVRAARRESESEAASSSARDAAGRARRAREEVRAAEERARRIEARISELAGEIGAASLEEAAARSEASERLEDELREVERSLTELAGPDPELWRAAGPADAPAEPPAWDPSERARLDRRLDRARATYRELRDAFVQAGLQTPEDVLTELRAARRERGELERDWAAGRLAGEVFATMDEVLERRLAAALDRTGPLSPASLLERITGRYRSLSRDPDHGLVLEDAEGRRFPADSVSRGTRDQVHLVLRAGLAGAALEAAGLDEPGFLLLDDAFLTADWTRRGRLVDAAADLAAAGWQVLYLTCDDHLRDIFVEAGAALHEL
ncbi:MAG TPA: hypothetical protein VKA44_07360, partial [Gemmatimonadota bacterium]|nr:hypothetical protein [Gemmatimonadota bacterium]